MSAYEHECDHHTRFIVHYPEGCKPFCAVCEIERLRLLIRCETILPPSDVTDDCTTELSVELAEAKVEIERLKAIADGLHNAINGLSDLVLDEGGLNNCDRAAKKITKQKAQIERLAAERDEREEAARWLYESDGDAQDKETARQRWKWVCYRREGKG